MDCLRKTCQETEPLTYGLSQKTAQHKVSRQDPRHGRTHTNKSPLDLRHPPASTSALVWSCTPHAARFKNTKTTTVWRAI
ncbi:hypothetical protein ACF0H5_016001 [Mactra antiquata]